MDIIQDQWSPVHSVATLLTSIQSLLTDPNCASPANPEAAQLYLNDRPAYNKCVCRGRTQGVLWLPLLCCFVAVGARSSWKLDADRISTGCCGCPWHDVVAAEATV